MTPTIDEIGAGLTATEAHDCSGDAKRRFFIEGIATLITLRKLIRVLIPALLLITGGIMEETGITDVTPIGDNGSDWAWKGSNEDSSSSSSSNNNNNNRVEAKTKGRTLT